MTMALALLLGCGPAASDVTDGTDGTDGTAGEQGPPGPAGEPGPPGPVAHRWVDAAGVEVSPTPDLGFFDDDELWWDVDPDTAKPTPRSPALVVYYELDGCAGEAWVASVPPAVAFTHFATDTIFRRPDDLQFEPEVCFKSTREIGRPTTCEEYEACWGSGIRLSASTPSTPIEVPTTGWAPPLRPAPAL